MKKSLLLLLMVVACASYASAQHLAVKTNALGWAAYGSPNLGVEVALWPKWTLDVDGLYNPFTYSDSKSTKIWAVQPEFRYWFCRKFTGHFIGLHGQYAKFDFGMRKYNYDGDLVGVGLSYGYALSLASRWLLEGNLGFGWNRKDYEKTEIPQWSGDVRYQPDVLKNKFGITRIGINVVFLIR